MTTQTVVIVVLAALLVYTLLRERLRASASWASDAASLRSELRSLAERLTSDGARLDRRLEGMDLRMTETQAQSSEMAASIFSTLGDVRRHTAVVADQARQFSSLQDLLRAPKMRGGLGEALLEELLSQVLPPHAYSCQHTFRSGRVVDAIVRAGERLVCIDAKFPLSNYRRMCEAVDDAERADAERAFAADVERHIKDISSRYIAPDEGTLDFAVMYVPAEGLYGEVLRLANRKRPLFETAIEARVVPMSPLTLYGFLQTVLLGLKCLSIEKSAEAVLGHCARLQREVELFAVEYDTLGKHIVNARSRHEEGGRRLARLRDKVEHVTEIVDHPEATRTLEAVREAADEV